MICKSSWILDANTHGDRHESASVLWSGNSYTGSQDSLGLCLLVAFCCTLVIRIFVSLQSDLLYLTKFKIQCAGTCWWYNSYTDQKSGFCKVKIVKSQGIKWLAWVTCVCCDTTMKWTDLLQPLYVYNYIDIFLSTN